MTKPKTHSPKISSQMYDHLLKPRKQFAEYVVSNAPGSNTRAIRGTDISKKVDAAANRNQGGFSAMVSKGTRPKHVAGKQSYKRV